MVLDAVKDVAQSITDEGIPCEDHYGESITVEQIQQVLTEGKPKAFIQGSPDLESDFSLSTRGQVATLNAFLTTIANAPKTAVEMLQSICALAMDEGGFLTRMGYEKTIGGRVFKEFHPQFQLENVARPNGRAWYCQQLMRFTYEII